MRFIKNGKIVTGGANQKEAYLNSGYEIYTPTDVSATAPKNLYKMENGGYGFKVGNVMHGITDTDYVERLFGKNIQDIQDTEDYGLGGTAGANQGFIKSWQMQPEVIMGGLPATPEEWLTGQRDTGQLKQSALKYNPSEFASGIINPDSSPVNMVTMPTNTQGTTPYYGTLQDLANMGLQVSNGKVYENGQVIGTYGGINPTSTSSTTEKASGLTSNSNTGQLALQKKVEETDKTLKANDEFVNAVFKAYHNRDANQSELDKYRGLTVGELTKIIKGGSPDRGFNSLLTPQQTQELDAASQRIASGLNSATDVANVNFATKSKGYKPPTGLIAPTIESPTAPEEQASGLTSDKENTRQELLDKIDELAGVKKTAYEAGAENYGLIKSKDALTAINQQIADKQVAFRKREAEIKGQVIDQRAIDRQLTDESRKYNAELADLNIQKSVAQADWSMAEELTSKYAEEIYEAKEFELKRLETELGFLDDDEKDKLEEVKSKLEFERKMALDGYIKINGPSGLKGLTENDIIRIPNANGVETIYKKPIEKKKSSLIQTPEPDPELNDEEKQFDKELKAEKTKLQKGGKWGASWNFLMNKYGSIGLTNTQLDAMLDKDKYYNN